MKVILMAAGIGSRISKSIDVPKCTLPINNTPLIVKTVDMFLEKGVEVAIVTGYKEEYIKKALSDRNVKYYCNPFYRATNSIASLWFAREFITDEDLILANADVYWGEGVFDVICQDTHPIVMLGDRSRVDTGDYFFYTDHDYITKFGKELLRDERTTEYVGIAKINGTKTKEFRTNLEKMIKKEKYNLWWENVLYEHLSESPVFVTDISALFWAEIDYIDDYERIKTYLRTGDIFCKNEIYHGVDKL